MAGEADRIARIPFGLAKRSEQRGTVGIEIAGEPAPAVVAAKRVFRLEQGDAHVRMRAVDRQRGQPASQPAADDSQIDHAPAH